MPQVLIITRHAHENECTEEMCWSGQSVSPLLHHSFIFRIEGTWESDSDYCKIQLNIYVLVQSMHKVRKNYRCIPTPVAELIIVNCRLSDIYSFSIIVAFRPLPVTSCSMRLPAPRNQKAPKRSRDIFKTVEPPVRIYSCCGAAGAEAASAAGAASGAGAA